MDVSAVLTAGKNGVGRQKRVKRKSTSFDLKEMSKEGTKIRDELRLFQVLDYYLSCPNYLFSPTVGGSLFIRKQL